MLRQKTLHNHKGAKKTLPFCLTDGFQSVRLLLLEQFRSTFMEYNMTIKSVTLSAINPISTPTTVNGVSISGYIDDVPCQFLRLASGHIKPSIGTVIHTSWGTGTVSGYTSNDKLRVVITDFNDDFEFVTADETDILTAEEYVTSVVKSMNLGVDSMRSTFERLYKSDITGVLTKRNVERMENAYPYFLKNEIVVNGSIKPLQPTDSVIVRMIPLVNKQAKLDAAIKARTERRQRLLERARRTLDECTPDDVAAEIRDAFGE